ncbi:sensor histidine kinase [Paludibaculum fermentans]|uniref:sensor histidine kinase n=1 Tax=Paludibaculum fermentans TaxID=1473598 RepID=UPI003EB6CAE7
MQDESPTPRWKRILYPQDLVWLLLFSALAWVSPTRGTAELEMLTALAILQVVAPRLEALSSRKGNLTVTAVKLVLGFLLIGVTGGIASSYYLILLLPVVSAATTLGALGTTAVTAVACIAYLAFIPLAYSLDYMMDWVYLRDLSLRVIFLPVVAYLTYGLVEANRNEARRAQGAAAELEEANRRLREAEASVRRSERLAALGQLTAGLAHELRNPLGTMKASAEILLEKIEPGNELGHELAGYISTEVDRTNSLITRFLEFARPVKLRLAPTDLNALIDMVIDQLGRMTPDSPPLIHKNYDPGIPLIEADAELLERVILNLIRNAVQASAPGLTVTVKTRGGPGIVEIAVIDRGHGIQPEHREQIFNPFFTTKPTGVGLGLAISAKIVDEHGGRITVESQPERGSLFLVTLPQVPPKDRKASAESTF